MVISISNCHTVIKSGTPSPIEMTNGPWTNFGSFQFYWPDIWVNSYNIPFGPMKLDQWNSTGEGPYKQLLEWHLFALMAIQLEVKMAVWLRIATISLNLENAVLLDFYFFLVGMILQFWSFQRNQLAARKPNQDMHKVN